MLCVDEKSQIRALDRTVPILPMQEGRIERRSHGYYRHGTSTLFAALDIATGEVTAAHKPRHRHQEFLALVKQIERTYLHMADEDGRPPPAPGDGRRSSRRQTVQRLQIRATSNANSPAQ